MKIAILSVVLSAILLAQKAPAPLTNQKIMDLVQTGVSQSEIIRLIASAQHFDFDLQPASTDAMMKAGVSEEIIKAMSAREAGSVPVIPIPSDPNVMPTSPSTMTPRPAAISVGTAAVSKPKESAEMQGSAAGKQNTSLQRTFDASPDRVYAAMVQAAGAEITAAVKEGCLVNLQTWVSTNFTQGEYRMAARCVDIGDGKTVVTLEAQTLGTVRNGASLFRGAARDKFVRVYWKRLDNALGQQSAAVTRPVFTSSDLVSELNRRFHNNKIPATASREGDVLVLTSTDVGNSSEAEREDFAKKLIADPEVHDGICRTGIRSMRLTAGKDTSHDMLIPLNCGK